MSGIIIMKILEGDYDWICPFAFFGCIALIQYGLEAVEQFYSLDSIPITHTDAYYFHSISSMYAECCDLGPRGRTTLHNIDAYWRTSLYWSYYNTGNVGIEFDLYCQLRAQTETLYYSNLEIIKKRKYWTLKHNVHSELLYSYYQECLEAKNKIEKIHSYYNTWLNFYKTNSACNGEIGNLRYFSEHALRQHIQEIRHIKNN